MDEEDGEPTPHFETLDPISKLLDEKLENVQMIPPTVQIHQFAEKFEDVKLFFQMTFLNGSCFIWVGTANPPNLGNLNVAMQTRFVRPLISYFSKLLFLNDL